MAIRVQKSGQRVEYILKADRKSSAPTVFVLRPLTWEENLEMQEFGLMTLEQAARINEIALRAKAAKRELTAEELAEINRISPMDMADMRKLVRQHATAVRYGVVEIRGATDLDGKPLEISAAEFAKAAPPAVLHELCDEILSLSRFAEDAIKK